MKDLEYDLVMMCRRNRDGAMGTQRKRQTILRMCARQLVAAGYTKLRKDGLKGRHIQTLVERWKAEGIEPATMKNYMAALRFWAEKIGKPYVVYRDNRAYAIPDRVFRNEDKSSELTEEALARISGPYADRIRLSLLLQRHFGLRREESLKFSPSFAIRREHDVITRLDLKSSWTKGGRPRQIPVGNETQREVLRACETLVGHGSLIPPDLSYKDYLSKFEYWTRLAGISRKHAFRHAYAQDRFRDLSGGELPYNHRARPQTQEAKARDEATRKRVAEELGHGRIEVTDAYVGRWSNR